MNEATIFLRGLGGFNYPGKGLIKPMPEIPNKNPDYKIVGETFPGQAFVYRLSFDVNPLHIDVNVAKAQNFERPILHGKYCKYLGLASYGTVARVFVQEIFGNDPSRLKSIFSRFVGHVYPGETLVVSVWKIENNKYVF